jgi:hypothetical protein
LFVIVFEVFVLFVRAGVFPQKTPEQRKKSLKFVAFFSNSRLFKLLTSLHLTASCGLNPATHYSLSAPGLNCCQATTRPRGSSIEFGQRSNKTADVKLPQSETAATPFPLWFLAIREQQCKD